MRYLSHLREAWNPRTPTRRSTRRTSPSPFPPRSTRPRASSPPKRRASAGYERMTLLEEPQAALYSWIQHSAGSGART
jgi:hypothetical protein